MKSVVIAGYYGFGNAGDELILSSLIQSLRAEQAEPTITVFSVDPLATAASHGIKAVNRWKPSEWLRPLRDADRFILGGGGLLQESSGPWNYLYYLSLLVVAKGFGCSTDICAIGVDPILHSWNCWLTRWVMDFFVDRLSVRDQDSLKALRSAGVRRDIAIRRDPVFELATPVPAEGRCGVGLALSVLPGEPDWAELLAGLCDHLTVTRCNPVDLLVLFPKQDETLAREVARLSSGVRRVRICRNPQDLLAWIPQYQVIVGSRFHALVLACAQGIPFYGFGMQAKVTHLCQESGMPCWDPSEGWNGEIQMKAIRALYDSTTKSVILAE